MLLYVRFKSDDFYALVRRKHFTETDILAFIGGLLGLFLGFSALSFIEFLYFFTLEPLAGRFTQKRVKASNEAEGIKFRPTRALKAMKRYIFSYMKSSSIHSFNYIGDSDRLWIERVAWLIAFILSMTCCSLMVQQLYQKLNINSIAMAIQDHSQDVSQIPFPAVTIFGTYPHPIRDIVPEDFTRTNSEIAARKKEKELMESRRNETMADKYQRSLGEALEYDSVEFFYFINCFDQLVRRRLSL